MKLVPLTVKVKAPSRRRRGGVQARRRRDWVVDREGLGIGGARLPACR